MGERWIEMGCEEKSSVIQEEIKRVTKLPSNSVYAVHRLKVLNKINDLLSVQVSCQISYFGWNKMMIMKPVLNMLLVMSIFVFRVVTEDIVAREGVRVALHTALSVKKKDFVFVSVCTIMGE